MSVVGEIIGDARRAASEFSASADEMLQSAANASQGRGTLNAQELEYNPQNIGSVVIGGLPSFNDTYNAPSNGAGAPLFADLQTPEAPTYPDSVTIDTNGLFEQEAPAFDIEPFTETAPVLDVDAISDEMSAIPDPDVEIIDAPVLSVVETPDVPNITIPTFDSQFADPNLIDPSDYSQIYKDAYDSSTAEMQGFIDNTIDGWMSKFAPEYKANLDLLQSKISEVLVGGGTGLSDEFEQNLYNRARAKISAEQIRASESLTTNISKRGFSLPPAALAAGLQNIQQETVNNLAKQAVEISIEREKMELQHLQFVMGLSQAVSGMLLNASVQYAQTLQQINATALEYSKQVASFSVDIYKQLLEQANLSIDVYRIESQVYETELKSSLAELESIKVEMDVSKLKQDINESEVDIYAKRIEAENSKITQYVSRLDGIAKKGELEKLRVELYGEQVNAYVGLLSAKESEVKAYSAAISGDTAKLNGEVAKVEAYSKEVDAAVSKSNLDIAVMDATSKYNNNLVQQYEAELSAYKAELLGESSRFDGSVTTHKAIIEAYKTENLVKLDELRTKLEAERLNLQAADSQFKSNIQIAIENSRSFTNSVKVQSDTAVGAGSVYGSMAAAGLSSQNTMASQIETL